MSLPPNELLANIEKVLTKASIASAELRELKSSVDDRIRSTVKSDDASDFKVQDTLKRLHASVQAKAPQNLGPFVSILKAMRPLLTDFQDVLVWIELILETFVGSVDETRESLADARDFVVEAMLHEPNLPDSRRKFEQCTALLDILLRACVQATNQIIGSESGRSFNAASQALRQVQGMLLAFGRKQPECLFHAIDRFLLQPSSRWPALQVLCAWLEQPQAHLDHVIKTQLPHHLVSCLLYDRSTVVVNTALQAMVMLLPWTPTFMISFIPQLLLIYERCLLWEKLSADGDGKDIETESTAISTSQKNGTPSDAPEWQRVDSVSVRSMAARPDVLVYFTYLYGLYPHNLTSFIKSPRQYLQDLDLSHLAREDLDETRVQSRTEPFLRTHIMHPTYFSGSASREREGGRWSTSEHAEIVAACLSLYVGDRSQYTDRVPHGKLDALRGVGDTENVTHADTVDANARDIRTDGSPFGAPLRIAINEPQSRDAKSADGSDRSTPDSRQLFFSPQSSNGSRSAHSSDVSILQQELHMLRCAYNFERYLKYQHVITIGQLKRDRLRQLVQYQETQSLVTLNHSLRKNIEVAARDHEKMQRETQSRKAHMIQSEDQLTTKIRNLRESLEDKKAMQTKLKQTVDDSLTLRQLLVDSEAREVQLKAQLENLKKDASVPRSNGQQSENANGATTSGNYSGPDGQHRNDGMSAQERQGHLAQRLRELQTTFSKVTGELLSTVSTTDGGSPAGRLDEVSRRLQGLSLQFETLVLDTPSLAMSAPS